MKKIILILICFYSMFANAQSFMIDQIVAFVGGKVIKQSDVENAYLSARAMGYPVRGDMKCSMFEELLIQKLLVNQAEVDSLVVEPSEVELDLNRRLEQYLQHVGSQELLEKHFNIKIVNVKEIISADLISGNEAKMMLASKSGPALRIRTTSLDENGSPIKYIDTICNYKVFSYKAFTNYANRYEQSF